MTWQLWQKSSNRSLDVWFRPPQRDSHWLRRCSSVKTYTAVTFHRSRRPNSWRRDSIALPPSWRIQQVETAGHLSLWSSTENRSKQQQHRLVKSIINSVFFLLLFCHFFKISTSGKLVKSGEAAWLRFLTQNTEISKWKHLFPMWNTFPVLTLPPSLPFFFSSHFWAPSNQSAAVRLQVPSFLGMVNKIVVKWWVMWSDEIMSRFCGIYQLLLRWALQCVNIASSSDLIFFRVWDLKIITLECYSVLSATSPPRQRGFSYFWWWLTRGSWEVTSMNDIINIVLWNNTRLSSEPPSRSLLWCHRGLWYLVW